MGTGSFMPPVRYGRRNEDPGPMGKANPVGECLPSYDPILLSEIFEQFRLHLGDR